MSRLRRYSMDNSNDNNCSSGGTNNARHSTKRQRHDNDHEEENKSMLRERTNKLWTLLAECPTNHDDSDRKNRAVAIVTHKGYLRELERGPFQRPHSTEFANGEIRVYRVTINTHTKTLIDSNRIV